MRRHLSSILVLFVLPICSFAQTGTPPFGSFTKGSFDLVNNQNANVIFTIPVASSPGRGLSLNFSAVYNSQIYAPMLNGAQAVQWTPVAGWLLNSLTGSVYFQYYTTYGSCGRGGQGYTQTTYYNNFVYSDTLGTSHPLNNINVTEDYSSCTDTTTWSGTYSGYATDASGYYASIADPSVTLTPTITTKSGVVINLSLMTVTDTNGNFLSAIYGTDHPVGGTDTEWTDTRGHTALKIITGSNSIQYKFLDPTGNYQLTTVNFSSFNVKTNFGCSNIIEYSATQGLPTSIVLPNNQTYTFTYEPTPGYSGYYTGRIKKVTLPTGGSYEYDYTGANDGTSCADGSTLGMNEVVSDGTNSATWKYVRSGGTTTITTPQLADTPNANDTVITFAGSQATQTKIYKESPGVNVLRTTNTTWGSNKTPTAQITILEDGSTQSEVDTTYDSNGLLDSAAEYDWGSGAHGALLRTTSFTYQTSTNYASRNIISLVTSRQIKDGTGTVQYRQDTTYDGVALLSTNCPTGAAQHNDTGFPCTFNYRGNPTAVTTYLTPATPANGITKNFSYDWFGNLITAQLNCCQNETSAYSSTTQYSQPDSVTRGTSPTQLTTTATYNAYTGQMATFTDENYLVTNYSYDTLRRPTQISHKFGGTNVGGTVSYSYDDTHFTATSTATIDSTKSVQQITAVDTLGRPIRSTTEDVNNNVISKISTQYDLAGRAYQVSNPYTGASASYWTTTAFDVLGRPTSVTLPDNSATTYSYSANTVTVTDPFGKQRKSQSDSAGRLSSTWEPDPSNNNTLTLQTSSTYNVLDELTQVTQGSQTRTSVYDALGRLLSTTTPEAGRVCLGSVSGSTCNADGYDSFNNLLKRTDARGVLTTYGYDTLNRPTSASYNVSGATGVPATSTVSRTYGTSTSQFNNGRLITMTDGVGSENYTYNNLGQLTQIQKLIGTTTYTTGYQYILSGELTQITYPSNRVVQQSVDAIGRLCEVAPSTTGCGTATSPYATSYGYSAAGQVIGFKYGNGIFASFGFASDRLQLNCLDYSTTNRGINCAHDSTTKFGLTYSYGSAGSNDGLISGITDNSGTQEAGRSVTYTYDSLNRLTRAVTTGSSGYPAWGLSEAYDRYGNRSAQSIYSGCTGITCPTNSVTISATTNQITGSPYSYDSNGNMTNDGQNTFVYDAENHAVSATNGSNAGTYVYDGKGLRVKKCIPNCTNPTSYTTYVFSGSKVVAEYDNGTVVGSPSREYIYSGASLLAKIDSSGTKYYHQDHLSNRYVSDSSGNKAAEIGHFPYGESWYNSTNDKLLFTTYERDSESGNDYAQARYDISRLGRFSSPDPITGSAADPQSLNRYSYVRNMPVMLTDPSGLCPGGYAQNYDANRSQEIKGGGPSNMDSDSEQIPTLGPRWPTGPCQGFTDQGGGAGGPGGVSIDGGEVFSPGDGASGLLGSLDSTVPCPNNQCQTLSITAVTNIINGQVLTSYGQINQFMAFASGGQGYYAEYGPGALYSSADQAGAAAGAFFFPDTMAFHREFGGSVTKDSEGFFSYDLNAVGPQCAPTQDCQDIVSGGGEGLWHTHPVPQDIVQFLGDRTATIPIPDYVTTSVGSSFGTFQISPWAGNGQILGQNLPSQIEMLDYPHIAPICQVSGPSPSFPGISPCH